MATKGSKRKACENCRAVKAKCIPSTVANTSDCRRSATATPDINLTDDERCIQQNKACIYRDIKPQPKRGPQAHTRVAMIEKQLQRMSQATNISERSHHQMHETPEPTHSEPIRNQPRSTSIAPTNGSIHRHSALPPEIYRDRDAIDKGILSEKEAQDLLDDYESISEDFPFVYVVGVSLAELRQTKPFLLLSILKACARKTRSLQILLGKELRETLASKVIVEGELSLDILQGLLLYLIWYHHNSRPCRQQIYLLTQICVSMAVDLEIHKPADLLPGFAVHEPNKTCMAAKRTASEATVSRVDGMRTYIGVYYLTTSISIMLRKPNGLTWSPYIEQCCQALGTLGLMPMDQYLKHYIKAVHLAEDISATFDLCAPKQKLDFPSLQLQNMVEDFVDRANLVLLELPAKLRQKPSMMSLAHTVSNLAYEIIFHVDARFSPMAPGYRNGWELSAIRASLLVSAEESIVSCLDWYDSLIVQEFTHLTILDMSRLSYNLLLLSKVDHTGIGDMPKSPERVEQIMVYFDNIIAKYRVLAAKDTVGTIQQKSIYAELAALFTASRDCTRHKIDRTTWFRSAMDIPAPNFDSWGLLDFDLGHSGK